LYSRRVLSGEFICVNKHLIEEMIKLNLWTNTIQNDLKASGGSIQKINGIPDHIKKRFRTIWEIP